VQARVDGRGLAPMRLAERSPAHLGAIGDEGQINVIGHQATGPDSDAMPAASPAQEIAVELMVGVGEEHGFAPISTLRHMAPQARNDETGDAGHEPGGLFPRGARCPTASRPPHDAPKRRPRLLPPSD
jgi:hypothetical protein